MTAEQIQALELAAKAWDGRPEMRCQVACAEVYFRAGLLPRVAIPDGCRDWSASQTGSVIGDWVEKSGLFAQIASCEPKQPTQAINAARQVGDLLGFRLGHALHHVSLQLSNGRILHVYGSHGVKIAPIVPKQWADRLAKVWRIK